MKLTREFFEKQNWDIGTVKVGNAENWMAELKKTIDQDQVYINASVTNILYPNRFALSGYLTSDCYITIMLYTEEDYFNLLKLAHLTTDFRKTK
jgi:hypothetical protein